MPKQTRKTIFVSLICILLMAIITFATIKLSHKRTAILQDSRMEELIPSAKETTLFPEVAKPSPSIKQQPPTEKVYPEVELPISTSEPQSIEEPTQGDFIFEQDDTNFIPPPLAEEG